MAGEPKDEFERMPAEIHAMMHEDDKALDPDAERFLDILKRSDAAEMWHKHGHFYSHLHDVWQMLCVWKQPREACRLGLFHSAYSNSYVSMNLYRPDTQEGRDELRALIGDAAELLVWKFCVIDRKDMELEAERTMAIPAEGRVFKHIRTGEDVHCSAREIGLFLVETVADYQDQSFGLQSDWEEGLVHMPWPGICKPTLRMSRASKLGRIARDHGKLDVVPPVFDRLTSVLDPAAERSARDLYWDAVCADPEKTPREELVASLTLASEQNRFVAEPHALRAQLLMQLGRWADAADAARSSLKVFYEWGTQWDKRMPFTAWISWTRCLLLQAGLKEWPQTHGGLESLGAVHPSQRFRALNTDRHMTAPPQADGGQAQKKAKTNN